MSQPRQLELPANQSASGNHVQKILTDLHASVERAAAVEYTLRCERMFRDCPGFIGADVPERPGASGWVTVKGEMIGDAVTWLKRRFHVNPSVTIDEGVDGIRFEVKTRTRSTGKKRSPFAKPEQFVLPLVIESKPK